MANSSNSLSSNFSRPLLEVFLEHFEASRVLSKTVDTQLLAGEFSPKSGTQVDVKRPHDYKTDRTATGDISTVDKSDIISGKATGTVQDYFTVHMDWDSVDEALKLNQLDEILKPAVYDGKAFEVIAIRLPNLLEIWAFCQAVSTSLLLPEARPDCASARLAVVNGFIT